MASQNLVRSAHMVWPADGVIHTHYAASYVNLKVLHDALLKAHADGNVFEALKSDNAEITLVPREGALFSTRAYVRPLVFWAISGGKHGLSPFHLCSSAQAKALEAQISQLPEASRESERMWFVRHMSTSNDKVQAEPYVKQIEAIDKAEKLARAEAQAREQALATVAQEMSEKDKLIAELQKQLAQAQASK